MHARKFKVQKNNYIFGARFKVGWMVKEEGKYGNVIGSISSTNKKKIILTINMCR